MLFSLNLKIPLSQIKSLKIKFDLIWAQTLKGRLLGVYDENGNPREEIVWFDGWRPVATIRGSAVAPDIYRITSDHLGAPLSVMDDNGVVVWEWDGREPFGFQMPNQDPDGDSNYFYLNMRFAGQWFDYETGLYHNGFRDYHPKAGRYIQSDPIGLEGGWNTYAYTENNPVNFVDPEGLKITMNGHFGPHYSYAEGILSRSPTASMILNTVAKSDTTYEIVFTRGKNLFNIDENGKRTIFWNPYRRLKCDITNVIIDPEILLAHELIHAYRDALGILEKPTPGLMGTIADIVLGTKNVKEEIITHNIERIISSELGQSSRRDYFKSSEMR